MLTLYIYGYLNPIQSSRRLGHEAQRNVELMWLSGRLAPDLKPSLTSAMTTDPASGPFEGVRSPHIWPNTGQKWFFGLGH